MTGNIQYYPHLKIVLNVCQFKLIVTLALIFSYLKAHHNNPTEPLIENKKGITIYNFGREKLLKSHKNSLFCCFSFIKKKQ